MSRQQQQQQQHEVSLAIYDLSRGMARQLSAQLGPAHAIEIVPHTGVVVFGKEYFFGGGIQSEDPVSFRRYSQLQPLQIVPLGKTTVSRRDFEAWCARVSSGKFHPNRYDLFHCNCNNFSDDAAKEGLRLNSGVPQWILDIPHRFLSSPMGQMMRPMLQNMQVGTVQGATPVNNNNNNSSSTPSSSTAPPLFVIPTATQRPQRAAATQRQPVSAATASNPWANLSQQPKTTKQPPKTTKSPSSSFWDDDDDNAAQSSVWSSTSKSKAQPSTKATTSLSSTSLLDEVDNTAVPSSLWSSSLSSMTDTAAASSANNKSAQIIHHQNNTAPSSSTKPATSTKKQAAPPQSSLWSSNEKDTVPSSLWSSSVSSMTSTKPKSAINYHHTESIATSSTISKQQQPLLDLYTKPLVSNDTKTVQTCIDYLRGAVNHAENGDAVRLLASLDTAARILSQASPPSPSFLDNDEQLDETTCSDVCRVILNCLGGDGVTCNPSMATFALLLLRVMVLQPIFWATCSSSNDTGARVATPDTTADEAGGGGGSSNRPGTLTADEAGGGGSSLLSSSSNATANTSKSIEFECLQWILQEIKQFAEVNHHHDKKQTNNNTTTLFQTNPAARSAAWLTAANVLSAAAANTTTSSITTWVGESLMDAAVMDSSMEHQTRAEVRQAACAFLYNFTIAKLTTEQPFGEQQEHQQQQQDAALPDGIVSLICSALEGIQDEFIGTAQLRRLMIVGRILTDKKQKNNNVDKKTTVEEEDLNLNLSPTAIAARQLVVDLGFAEVLNTLGHTHSTTGDLETSRKLAMEIVSLLPIFEWS